MRNISPHLLQSIKNEVAQMESGLGEQTTQFRRKNRTLKGKMGVATEVD